MPDLLPYTGSVRKLVLAMDVGTTHSGVAYAILDPGEVPKIHSVTRFPGQEDSAGDFKIPSKILYRQNGTVAYVGAEATALGMDVTIKDESLVLSEWFKLHLRPKSLGSNELKKSPLPPLPLNKTAEEVFTDFLAYLFRCTRQFIRETHANGESIWTALQGHIELILSHPNGWEGLQQGKMRDTAVTASIVPDTDEGRSRVHFVTEGEASLNFCIHNGLTSETMRNGKSVIIVDAGGGTVDISTYEFTSVSPLTVEEVTAPDCLVQGSTRVNARAKKYLTGLLANSSFGDQEDIESMLEQFDKATKRVFKDDTQSSFIKFGSMKCNDPSVNISRGQLTLSGDVMRSFFQPCVDAIFSFVTKQKREANVHPPDTVFLVGGFAASPWLHSELKSRLKGIGLTLYRPDTHTDKAVSSGALCFYLEHFVSARVAKATYGTEIAHEYTPWDPEHRKREAQRVVGATGMLLLPNGFASLLIKGTRVHESKEIAHSFSLCSRVSSGLDTIECDIICFRGKEKNPLWTDVHPEQYTKLCTIHADTSQITREAQLGFIGAYYMQRFEVVLRCGLTEMQAYLRWDDKGTEKRGPAKIVYADV